MLRFQRMSGTLIPAGRMAPAEYLVWEREQRDRFQYVRGEVFAMAGGSPRHNLLGANVTASLHRAMRGGPCRAFSSDQKIRAATGDYVYADVAVVCGPVALREGTTDVIENPRAIVEVLSDSTERYDRGDKWEGYRELTSLTDYVLVSQRVSRLEHFSREPDGSWKYRVVGEGEQLELTNGVVLVVDELYEGAFAVPGDAL